MIVVIVMIMNVCHRFGRVDDTVGNPRRARLSQFELLELILLLELDRQVPVERFEPTASQSTVSSPPSVGGHGEWNELSKTTNV